MARRTFLAFDDGGFDDAVFFEILAQLAEQVLAEARASAAEGDSDRAGGPPAGFGRCGTRARDGRSVGRCREARAAGARSGDDLSSVRERGSGERTRLAVGSFGRSRTARVPHPRQARQGTNRAVHAACQDGSGGGDGATRRVENLFM